MDNGKIMPCINIINYPLSTIHFPLYDMQYSLRLLTTGKNKKLDLGNRFGLVRRYALRIGCRIF